MKISSVTALGDVNAGELANEFLIYLDSLLEVRMRQTISLLDCQRVRCGHDILNLKIVSGTLPTSFLQLTCRPLSSAFTKESKCLEPMIGAL
jgi:hypothetical protein